MFNGMTVTSMAYYGSEQHARVNVAMVFSQVLSRGKRSMFLQKLVGKNNSLQTLAKVKNGRKPVQKPGRKIVTVALEKIVGSEGRVHDFDKNFRPLVSHTRDRWVGIAVAHRQGLNLPPVELIQVGDEFYVRDGHHRISVAKAFGQATIEAEIACELA